MSVLLFKMKKQRGMTEHFPWQVPRKRTTIPSYKADVLCPSHNYSVLKQADMMLPSDYKDIVASFHDLRALLFVRQHVANVNS
jgi:hypothetical protein